MGEKTNSYKVTFTVDNLTSYRSRELEGWLHTFGFMRDVKVIKVNTVAEHLRNTIWGPKNVRSHERRDHVPAQQALAPQPQPQPKQQAKPKQQPRQTYVDGQVVQDNRKFR